MLSEHFSLAELTRSARARALGIDNTPGPLELSNLEHLARELAEPLRGRVGALKVTSGYRSPELNAAVGGSSTSAHMAGRAMDVAPLRSSSERAFRELYNLWLERRAMVDQAILYHPTRGGHVHLGWSDRPRGEFLYAGPAGGYTRWRP